MTIAVHGAGGCIAALLWHGNRLLSLEYIDAAQPTEEMRRLRQVSRIAAQAARPISSIFKRSTDPEFAARLEDLDAAITRYVAATNRNPKPFVWTATAKTIRTKLALNHPSESVH